MAGSMRNDILAQDLIQMNDNRPLFFVNGNLVDENNERSQLEDEAMEFYQRLLPHQTRWDQVMLQKWQEQLRAKNVPEDISEEDIDYALQSRSAESVQEAAEFFIRNYPHLPDLHEQARALVNEVLQHSFRQRASNDTVENEHELEEKKRKLEENRLRVLECKIERVSRRVAISQTHLGNRQPNYDDYKDPVDREVIRILYENRRIREIRIWQKQARRSEIYIDFLEEPPVQEIRNTGVVMRKRG